MFWIKVALSALIIAIVSEIAKRSTFWGAALVSLPLSSMLAMGWLYYETRDMAKVNSLGVSVFYLVVPSLAFFIAFNLAFKFGCKFPLAFALAALACMICYPLCVYFYRKMGIDLG